MNTSPNEITDELYSARYDAKAGILALKGTLRLNGAAEYAPIVALLSRALDEHAIVLLDLSDLAFLNSSGIATLSRFVIDCRNRESVVLTIRGSKSIAWQGKSLVNLGRLMPALRLEFA